MRAFLLSEKNHFNDYLNFLDGDFDQSAQF